jgi:glycosyltransferase involved in cell wall biosynthesis
MRIAFYAPLKAPGHATPSGDRRMGRLIVAALEAARHKVVVASDLRTYCPAPQPARQAAIRDAALAEVERLTAEMAPPDCWFTYHVYYKAPDWIGPAVAAHFGVPYIIAEASYAPKRAEGLWAIGHAAVEQQIAAADAVINLTRLDKAMVEPLLATSSESLYIPPFLDTAPFTAAADDAAAHRASLAAELSLDPARRWLLCVAMMRSGPKLESYQALGKVLSAVKADDWTLVVAGDGPERAAVEAALAPLGGRVVFAGEQPGEALPGLYAACDLTVWPAVHEAYGMTFLESQAAGTAVVAGRVRGVPDVVEEGVGGMLAPEGDNAALARLIDLLLEDDAERKELGRLGRNHVSRRRNLEQAAKAIDGVLQRAQVRRAPAPAPVLQVDEE